MTQTMNADAIKNLADGLALINKMTKVCDNILLYIEKNMFQCNACKNDVFFLPDSTNDELMRKQSGFMYWNAKYQLHSKRNYRCPVCKSRDRDRLIIAFLEMIQAEKEEMLRMLYVVPAPSVEDYALNRADIHYESMDLEMPKVTLPADIQNMSMVEDGNR